MIFTDSVKPIEFHCNSLDRVDETYVSQRVRQHHDVILYEPAHDATSQHGVDDYLLQMSGIRLFTSVVMAGCAFFIHP